MSARICEAPNCKKHAWHNSIFCVRHIGTVQMQRPTKSGKNICPYCNRNSKSNLTRDHIVPQYWTNHPSLKAAYRLVIVGTNIRYVCSSCNVARALAAHCVGALACALSVYPESPNIFFRGASWALRRRKTNKRGRDRWRMVLFVAAKRNLKRVSEQ